LFVFVFLIITVFTWVLFLFGFIDGLVVGFVGILD
jgi:hypothetical protein